MLYAFEHYRAFAIEMTSSIEVKEVAFPTLHFDAYKLPALLFIYMDYYSSSLSKRIFCII